MKKTGNGSAYSVSLKTIAEYAGVSVSTVSRVLNQKGELSDETRKKILGAADELGYNQNFLVRGVFYGETRSIGVILPFGESYYSSIMRGIHSVLYKEGYVPIVLESEPKVYNECDQIERLMNQRVEGIIIRPSYDKATDDYFQEIVEKELPIITIDRDLPHAHLGFVAVDDVAAGRLAARRLIDAGAQVLGHLGGAMYTSSAKWRKDGFKAEVVKAGLDYVECHSNSYSYDLTLARQLLSNQPRPDAIFAANDEMAMSVYDAALELGLSIPDDISLIGMGNYSRNIARKTLLTTIEQCPVQIGVHAATMLLGELKKTGKSKSRKKSYLVDPVLVEGDTVR